ncbi:MAG: Flp pilus assembly protein CpaB [Acidobacteria bacterium]|nr:Flp pilus assembly protein CpaB [Acidobacteriota bacterium]
MDRQKILMIFGAAWISALLLTWLLYAKVKTPQQDKVTQVVAAARDMPAGTRIRQMDLKTVGVREKDLPKGAVLDAKQVTERALLFPVNVNEPITSNKLTSLSGADGLSAMIEQGKRAVSVQITDASAAGGLIQPRSKVDVLFTRSGSLTEALTTVILEDVTVLSMGRVTEVAQPADPRQVRPQQQAATLLVTPEEAKKLELAKNQGKISLALRNPLDRSTVEDDTPATAFDLDPMVAARLASRRRPGGRAGVRDDQAWARLIGAEEEPKKEEKKEPPKPRFIIDVYRGDKHVQETFQD